MKEICCITTDYNASDRIERTRGFVSLVAVPHSAGAIQLFVLYDMNIPVSNSMLSVNSGNIFKLGSSLINLLCTNSSLLLLTSQLEIQSSAYIIILFIISHNDAIGLNITRI